MNSATTLLVRLASQSPRDGFALLHRHAARQLYLWSALHVRAPLRRWMPLDDFVQETWARAYAGFGEFDPGRGRFHAWLFGIAYNVLREQLRAMRGCGTLEGAVASGAVPDPATTVVTGLARDESRRQLLAAVDAMAETDRRLVLWRGLEGLPYGEVASRLGITVAAAESRWRRVCQRLRQVLPELRLAGGC